MHGGPVISAWEVEQIDEIWLDAFMGMAVDLPSKKKRVKAEKDRFREFEKKHPQYGKTLRKN